jgi:hypothetical protein
VSNTATATLTEAEDRAVQAVRAVLAEDPACPRLEAAVARRLGIKPSTVHAQLHAARGKLGVRRTLQLIRD